MKRTIILLVFLISFSIVQAQVDDVFWKQHKIIQIELDIENDCLKLLDTKKEKSNNKTSKCEVVNKQIDAYNARKLDAFLSFYSDSNEAYLFPDSLLGKGKKEQRIVFDDLFANAPNLHIEIIKRICFGDYVIDHEIATGIPRGKTVEAVEIYKVENNEITKVWVIYK